MNSADYFPRNLRYLLIDTLGQWVQNYTDQNWKAYFVTFMFNPLQGNRDSVIRQMGREVEQFYSTLITRVIRNPRSPLSLKGKQLPILIGFPDMPGLKVSRRKYPLPDVDINDGLHFHAMVLLPAKSRLKDGFKRHVEENQDLYLNRIRTRWGWKKVRTTHGRVVFRPVKHRDIMKNVKLQRIHVERTRFTPQDQLGYELKAFAFGKLPYDHLIILPRAVRELPDRKHSERERQKWQQLCRARKRVRLARRATAASAKLEINIEKVTPRGRSRGRKFAQSTLA